MVWMNNWDAECFECGYFHRGSISICSYGSPGFDEATGVCRGFSKKEVNKCHPMI